MNILHLSQTDIRSDSRILKEMSTLAQANTMYKVNGIGVSMDEGASFDTKIQNIKIYTVNIKSRQFKYLPKVLIHILMVIEITLKMLFKSIKLKPNIVHCNDIPVLPLGVVIKFFTGAKLVYDAHELESDRNGLTKTLGKLTLFVEKRLWRFIDALIVVSPSIEQWYKNNIGEKYSEVILNSPVLEKNIKPFDKSYLRDKFSIPKEVKIFLYIGILGEGRGIDLMVEVFKKNDITSHLVFLGYGELSDKLKEVSKKYLNIHIHDAVPHEKVVSVAQSADIGMCLIQNVSLSDYYCLPNKLFEYCFAEIPVLASNFPDISATVDKYNLGKCCNLDIDSIYEKIKEFEENDDNIKIVSDNLYDLSWGAQEKKLVRLYQYIEKDIN